MKSRSSISVSARLYSQRLLIINKVRKISVIFAMNEKEFFNFILQHVYPNTF